MDTVYDISYLITAQGALSGMGKVFAWRGFHARFAATLDALYKIEGPDFGQVEFARRVVERSGVPFIQSRVSTLRNSRADPSLEEVEILAAGLGVSPGWLAYGQGGAAGKLEKSAPPPPETRLTKKTKPAPRSDDLPAVANPRKGRGGR